MQNNLIDVPEVRQLPELSGWGESPIGFADMVLTSLLNHHTALLFAESGPHAPADHPIGWHVRPHEGDLEGLEMGLSPSLDSFRSVLTRFGEHYMGGVTHHGYALTLLRQEGRIHRCHFYLCNSEESGFWIRVYATRATRGGTQISERVC